MQENILRTTLVEVFERETMVNEIQGRTGATPFPKTLLFECILLRGCVFHDTGIWYVPVTQEALEAGFWHS